MYRVANCLGALIRQVFLPNPFSPFGGMGELINLFATVVFIPLSYEQVSMIYVRKSNPAIGSIMFTIVYAINTGVTYLIMLLYPIQWMMILVAAIYLIASFALLEWLGKKPHF